MKLLKVMQQWKAGLVGMSLLAALGMSFGLGAPASAAPSIPAQPVKYMAAPADNCPQLKDLHTTSKDTGKGGGQGMNCFIKQYVNPMIKFLAGVVGVFVVISIVAGGIQYATSADDPGKVSAAKQRIFQSVIGLLAFIFLMAFLQWVVPGGIRG